MNGYKRRMEKYRLPKARYMELREYCRTGSTEEIKKALALTKCGALVHWIEKHVCSCGEWKWSRMEADGIPCNDDTFRIYRAKFYWNLDKILREKEGGKI